MKTTPVSYGKILDPDGYLIEIIEGNCLTPFHKVLLRVMDLDETVKFYTESLNFKLLRRRANINSIPKEASLISYLVSEIVIFWNIHS